MASHERNTLSQISIARSTESALKWMAVPTSAKSSKMRSVMPFSDPTESEFFVIGIKTSSNLTTGYTNSMR
jgi:hypothetical protein